MRGGFHHGIGSPSSSSKWSGRNMPPPYGGGNVPLALFFEFRSVPLAFRTSDLHVPRQAFAFRSMFRSAAHFAFRTMFRNLWWGVSVPLHPLHDMHQATALRCEGREVDDVAGVPVGDIVAPEPLVLQVNRS